MNSNSEGNNIESQAGTGSREQPPVASAQSASSKKRRWWVYLLIALGSLILLGVIVVVAIYSYYRSVINNYTELKPREFPPISISQEHVQNLISRWTNYIAAVLDRHSTDQFILTEEDVNQAIVNFSKGRDFARVVFTNGYIKALLRIPLETTGKKELQGRYLNADAYLKLQIEDGILTLRLESATANGKPVPNWIIKKIRQKNLLENLENNYDFLELIQAMENVQVKDGAVVFTPIKDSK